MYPTDETAHNPLDHDLAIKNAEDIMLRYRNHPSLVLWCIACEVTVDEDLYIKTRKLVKELDQTRPFLAASSYDWDVEKYTPYIKEDLPLGMTDAVRQL
jgi:exo-1,4-beta-D-glucosaminidase